MYFAIEVNPSFPTAFTQGPSLDQRSPNCLMPSELKVEESSGLDSEVVFMRQSVL